MHLAEYLRLKKISYRRFAELIEYSHTHMLNVVNGKTKPNKRLATLISIATQGEVSVKDMMSPPKSEKIANPVNPFHELLKHESKIIEVEENMHEWVSVKDKYPEHNQKIKIRVEDATGKEHQLESIFRDSENYRSWQIKPPENVNIYARPTHWMPLPKPPEENE